jgi:hypothetical protein
LNTDAGVDSVVLRLSAEVVVISRFLPADLTPLADLAAFGDELLTAVK